MVDYQLQDYSTDPVEILSARNACHILALSSIKHLPRTTKHRTQWMVHDQFEPLEIDETSGGVGLIWSHRFDLGYV